MPKKDVNYDTRTVTWDFEDGGEDLSLCLDDCPEEIQLALGVFAISEKGGNTYAGAKGESERLNITPAQYARGQVETFIRNMKAGEFRASSGGGTARVPAAVKALAQALGIDEGEARELYSPAELQAVDGEPEADAKERAKALRQHQARIRNHPQVKEILDQWALEKAQAELAKSKEVEAEFDLSSLTG